MSYEQGSTNVTAKCHRSMRKSELPHQLHLIVEVDSKAISGKCSCVAGLGGYCNHMIGLLYYLAHCKQLGFSSLPDDLTCTSMKERWSIPRERKIGNQEVQSVLVKKPRPGANYDQYIKKHFVFTSKAIQSTRSEPLQQCWAKTPHSNYSSWS